MWAYKINYRKISGKFAWQHTNNIVINIQTYKTSVTWKICTFFLNKITKQTNCQKLNYSIVKKIFLLACNCNIFLIKKKSTKITKRSIMSPTYNLLQRLHAKCSNNTQNVTWLTFLTVLLMLFDMQFKRTEALKVTVSYKRL